MNTFVDVEHFLRRYPNPYDTFSNKYDRTDYEGNAEIYLQARYEGASSDEINDLINKQEYNIFYTCYRLEKEKERKATPFHPDKVKFLPSATERFYHEVWFVEHRPEIDEYLHLTPLDYIKWKLTQRILARIIHENRVVFSPTGSIHSCFQFCDE